MKTKIKLEIIGEEVKVTSPFNGNFVKKAKNYQGKWKSEAWWFSVNQIEYVRKAMIEIYGLTGEESYETCTLIVEGFSASEMLSPVSLFNRTIAAAHGRDDGAKLGEGIILLEGEVTSGGSVKNWKTCVENATFEILDFPIPALELPEVKEAIAKGWCKVKKEKNMHSESKEIFNIMNTLLWAVHERIEQEKAENKFNLEDAPFHCAVEIVTEDKETFTQLCESDSQYYFLRALQVEAEKLKNINVFVHIKMVPKIRTEFYGAK
ncbi:hypothetical protein EZS27_021455 [termite gut metagenome]|uniref:Uncharacterized protein n=1 Tax=termite gut metagenome TaxID=433724 RepID=A0A5J4R7Y2_9ZZZZ